MNLRRTILRLREATEDDQALRRSARDVGHELPRKRIALLSRFRSALTTLDADKASDFVVGYRSALADVVAAYEEAIQPELDAGSVIRLVKSKKHWPFVLKILTDRPETLSEIAVCLSVNLSTASKVLAAMRRAGLVDDCALADGGDLRSRPQRLSLMGEKVVGMITLEDENG